jgi:catechol 2,3-dioxygenase-like lactoylglutathione lyase family enzyme
MMKLNHLNLAVADVASTRAFFETFFDMRCTETKGDNVLSVLVDDTGFTLILSNFDKNTAPHYPRDFHLGFIQDSIDDVKAIHHRMKEAGVDVPAPRTSHGSWGFYIIAPGGITIEVSSYENEK